MRGKVNRSVVRPSRIETDQTDEDRLTLDRYCPGYGLYSALRFQQSDDQIEFHDDELESDTLYLESLD
jgi:hypothetical protein